MWNSLPEDKFAILYSSFQDSSSSGSSGSANRENDTTNLPCSSPLVRLAYNTFGSSSDPCLLLLQDAGSPGLYWHETFCQCLANKGPFFVVRYDQRDTGRSTSFSACCTSGVASAIARAASFFSVPTFISSSSPFQYARRGADALLSRPRLLLNMSTAGGGGAPSYTLSDLAQDALELLNKLGVRVAHVVGLGLGAAVIQQLLIMAPDRVLSAALISPYPTNIIGIMEVRKEHYQKSIVRKATDGSEAAQRTGLSAHSFAKSEIESYWKFHYGPSYPLQEQEIYERLLWCYDRHPPPEGGADRHLAAFLSAPQGWYHALRQLNPCCEKLAKGRLSSWWSISPSITNPNNIILYTLHLLLFRHGHTVKALAASPAIKRKHIPIVLICGGRDCITSLEDAGKIAHLIPGCTLVAYPDMGHVVPEQLFSEVVEDILYNAEGKGRYCTGGD